MTTFAIAIVSDTVCPWCYIGLRNLQRAIAQRHAQHPQDTFSLTWHPFQLNPQAPRDRTVDKRQSYETKLGVEGARNVLDRLRAAGATAGITFNFDGRIGNTLDSHRLIEYAGRQSDLSPDNADLQTTLVEELFAEYFERGQDITSHDVLSRAAVRAGVADREDTVRTFLDGGDLSTEVQRQANGARQEGVNGVPQYTIKCASTEYVIEGAQEPMAFLHLFNRLAKIEKAVL